MGGPPPRRQGSIPPWGVRPGGVGRPTDGAATPLHSGVVYWFPLTGLDAGHGGGVGAGADVAEVGRAARMARVGGGDGRPPRSDRLVEFAAVPGTAVARPQYGAQVRQVHGPAGVVGWGGRHRLRRDPDGLL